MSTHSATTCRHPQTRLDYRGVDPVAENPCRNLYFQTLVDGTFNSARVAGFLRDLLKHLRGNIIVVWDNGPMHKGPAIRKLLKRNPRLTIEHLPPYAPELNPVEPLWSHLKYGYCSNLISNDLDQLDDEAMNFLLETKIKGKKLVGGLATNATVI